MTNILADFFADYGVQPIETWVMSSEKLDTEFRNSAPGEVVVYAVGDLANERLRAEAARYLAVHDTAELAMSLSDRGKAVLTQKRLGPNKYEYRCQKVVP